MPEEQDVRYINDAVKTIYMTYINGESPDVQLSLALTLLVNIIERTGQKIPMLDTVYNTLDHYASTKNVMDLANGNQE